MKRLTAWILVIALSVCALPLDAIAQNQYEKNFVVLSNTGKEEKAFREWAAKLVDVYRNDYAMVTDNNTFTQDYYLFYEWKDSAWSLYKDVFDDCLYHPYYEAAQKKQEYNFSKEANAQHEGDTVKETEYTLMDDQELIGVYMWIIRETIQEKAKVDPMFFMQEIEGNERYYSYSVKDGIMVFDPELKNLQDVTNGNMMYSFSNLAISALNVAIEAFYAYEEIKNKGEDILNNAKDKALKKEKDFMEEFKKSMTDELKETLQELLIDTLKDVTKQVNTRFNQSMNAIIRTQATLDLLNGMLDCNENVVAYLKSTYVENSMMIADEKFAETVQAVITVMESPEFEAALQSKAEITVTDQTVQMMMEEAGVEISLPQDALEEVIIRTVVGNVAQAIINLLGGTVDSLIDAAYESNASKNNVSKKDKKLYETLKNYGTKLTDDLTTRANKCVDAVVKAINDDEWTDETLSNIFKEQFGGLNAKSEPWIDSFRKLTVDLVLQIIYNAFFGEFNETDSKKSEETLKKETVDLASSFAKADFIKLDEQKELMVNLGGSGNTVSFFVKTTIYTCLKGITNGIKAYVKRTGTEFTPAEIDDITGAIDRIEKLLEGGQKAIDGLSEEETYAIEQELSLLIVDIIEIIIELISDYANEGGQLSSAYGKLFTYLFTENNGQYGIITILADESNMKAFLDADYVNLVLSMIFGNSVANLDKKIAGLGVDYGAEDIAIKIWMDTIEDTINSEIEDVLSIVGSVWDSMMDCSKNLLKAWHSACGNAAGENNASLIAERMRIVYEQSKDLEAMNLQYTLGGRWESYNNFNSYSDYLAAWVNDRYDSSMLYRMNAQDITYYDEKMQAWILTPDIHDIEVLTDYILTQMHLDAVGYGAYLTLLKERNKYSSSPLFSKYYKKHVLIEQQQAVRRQQTMIRIIDNAESTRP